MKQIQTIQRSTIQHFSTNKMFFIISQIISKFLIDSALKNVTFFLVLNYTCGK